MIQLHGWVLHLRGLQTAVQPRTINTGSLLCFNGEIYSGIDVPLDISDTEILAKLIAEIDKQYTDDDQVEQQLCQIVSRMEGEWALVFYHSRSNRIYYGRDFLGRRSLLLHMPLNASDQFILSSVGPQSQSENDLPGGKEEATPDEQPTFWIEVPTSGLFCIDLDMAAVGSVSGSCIQFNIEPRLIPWSTSRECSNLICPSLVLNTHVPTETELDPFEESDTQIKLPELVPRSPMHAAVLALETALSDSVRRRIENIPAPSEAGHARLAILFSGGLDCIVLAALCDRVLPSNEPIDLLNAGFENPRIGNHKAKQASKKSVVRDDTSQSADKGLDWDPYNVPDRVTGRLGAAELAELFPNRRWRLVETNVPYSSVLEHRAHIMSLIAPLHTTMDLSIAMAFWFAASGVGSILTKQQDEASETAIMQPFESKARVLLSGLGADEQLGGYGRHKVQYKTGSWPALIAELQLDVSRISTRNLGRDDRIVSSHGKEVRFPFLDAQVTDLLCSMPVHLKLDPRRPKGVGDKTVLRYVAAHRLSLFRASVEPKRAVQFGARTAKMESGKQKGQDSLIASNED
eukprot:jgi/Hompol1/6325/HPOL_002247-RA